MIARPPPAVPPASVLNLPKPPGQPKGIGNPRFNNITMLKTPPGPTQNFEGLGMLSKAGKKTAYAGARMGATRIRTEELLEQVAPTPKASPRVISPRVAGASAPDSVACVMTLPPAVRRHAMDDCADVTPTDVLERGFTSMVLDDEIIFDDPSQLAEPAPLSGLESFEESTDITADLNDFDARLRQIRFSVAANASKRHRRSNSLNTISSQFAAVAGELSNLEDLSGEQLDRVFEEIVSLEDDRGGDGLDDEAKELLLRLHAFEEEQTQFDKVENSHFRTNGSRGAVQGNAVDLESVESASARSSPRARKNTSAAVFARSGEISKTSTSVSGVAVLSSSVSVKGLLKMSRSRH
jgi:hypothetical protein